MKVSVSVSLRITILLAIAIVAVSVLVGCNKKAQQPDIIRKDYKYQKANWEFNFHLENIGNSDKISNLVNKLIYDSRDFDEYVSKMEHSVLKDSSDPDVDNTRGSYLSAKYSIIYADEKYIVITYFYEESYGDAPHPNHKYNCFFIDIPEERLLLINDLINPIPEKTLLDLIIKSYENDGGLDADNIMRDTIWPPDLITVGYENHSLIYLVWNTYTLLPHAYGPVEVTGSEISQHLTDKGKEIMKRLAATAPQKPAEEKPAADGAETATAQAAETPEGDDGSVDFGKLTLKGDVYYLNNAPFTGTARKVLDDGDAQEKYEMKDGKFHGKFTGDYPNSSVTGYYKDGKKHGEWKASGYSEGTYFEIHNYKDGKKHGEWKYIKEVFGDEEGKPYKEMIGGEGEGKYQLYKTETWENDKLIGGMSNLDGIKLTYVAGNGKIKDFYIGTYEITQTQWLRWTILSSHFRGDNLPVETVNCDDVQKFLQRMNEKTGRNYRLPTEEEWEYAARGGNKSKGYKYSGSDNIDAVAWYEGNSGEKTHPVGTKQPNELGIYDMTGNVWEWTSTEGYIDGDTYRVMRGGCWGCDAEQNTVSHSTNSYPNDGGYALGFRVALDAEF